MKKRIIPLILVFIFCVMQIPAFAASFELDFSTPEAPFSLTIQDQTEIFSGDLEEPMIVYTDYEGMLEESEWTSITAFSEDAVFTVTNNSVDAIQIYYLEYQKDEYLEYQMSAQGHYLANGYEQMEFVNGTGFDGAAFMPHIIIEYWSPDRYYNIEKGETVTFQIPIQDQRLCELYVLYFDADGAPVYFGDYPAWRFRLMKEGGSAAADQPSEWAKTEVTAAINAGLVPENLQKNYTAPVSRADVAQMFVNLLEKAAGMSIDDFLAAKGVEINPDAFSDTTEKAVLACNALGIINGVGNGKFDPNSTFTRAQIAAILNRIAGVVGIETSGYSHSFTDVDGHWCSAELGWPAHVGIINGVGDNRFDPDGKLTTEQAIALTYRAMNIIG